MLSMICIEIITDIEVGIITLVGTGVGVALDFHGMIHGMILGIIHLTPIHTGIVHTTIHLGIGDGVGDTTIIIGIITLAMDMVVVTGTVDTEIDHIIIVEELVQEIDIMEVPVQVHLAQVVLGLLLVHLPVQAEEVV